MVEYVDSRLANNVATYCVVRHTIEDIEECSLVELLEILLSSLAEENVRSLLCCLQVFCRVYHSGNLFSKTLLEHTATRILLVLFYESIDSLFVEVGEYLDILFSIVVANVEPELIESIRSCAVAIEPDVSAFGLAKLLTVSLGNQRTGEAEYLNIVAQCAVDELCTCSHVAPLVVAAKL